ncbi:MAG: DUF523 domain-containing protein [Acidobacteriota bacterium]
MKKISFPIICSACLLGIKCRYDGKSVPDEKVVKISSEKILIPVCPEQMGGLPTPRASSEIIGERVINKVGEDVTEYFEKGAEEALKLAKIFECKEAILKQRSPSCGSGRIYDGTFSGKVIKGDGITAKLLKENGIKVITEEDL